MRIECSKELGRWTVRVNGIFIVDFWRESLARRTAMNLARAALKSNTGEKP